MKKRILVCVCTLAIAIGLTACGSNENKTYGGYTEDQFEATLESYMSTLESSFDEATTATYIEQAESQDQDAYVDLFTDWQDCLSVKGEFLEFSDFSCEKSGKTLTCTLTADYTGRDLKLIFVYNVNSIDDGPTAMNVEPVYSLGETMGKAALNTVMGILIVFVMLVLMSLIISCFRFIPVIEKKFKNKGTEEKAAVSAPVAVETSSVDDLELIAVITAAIAASTGESTDSFVVRSIKRRY